MEEYKLYCIVKVLTLTVCPSKKERTLLNIDNTIGISIFIVSS